MPIMSRVTWEDGEYGTQEGKVNGFPLFTLNYGSERRGGYSLKTALPVRLQVESSRGAEDDLKLYAERLLAGFVKLLGASFPE